MWKFFVRQSNQSTLSDEELVMAYKRDGKKSHIAVLYERYAQHLFGFSLKYLKDEEQAKDVVATIFSKLFDDLLRFEVKYFKGWILRVAYNKCIDRLSEEKKKSFIEDQEWLEEDVSDEEIPLPDNESLIRAMNQLKKEHRECLELFYLHGMSYQAVSEKLGYSLSKVKSYIQNGKRNLLIHFQSQHGESKA